MSRRSLRKDRDQQAMLPMPELGHDTVEEKVSTLVPELERIRGFVAANGQGMTRDEVILEEITKLLHAKVQDETARRGSGTPRFVADERVRENVNELLREAAECRNGGTWTPIAFDDNCLLYSVGVLQDRRLLEAGRDVIGEAYESLIFPSLRGGQGQFFTPKNISRCLAELLEIEDGQKAIDPACGTGGFLLEVAKVASARGATLTIAGIDKDALLARMAGDSLSLQVGGASVVCANSLVPADQQTGHAREYLAAESYDVVITNPPFGAKIPVTGDVLLHYELARQWVFDRGTRRWIRTGAIKDSVAPQVLFIELCWKLLREGGRCGIVLPEGVLGNQGTGFIRQWLVDHSDILAVVDCPLETFMPSTSTKTAIIVFEKHKKPRRPPVFMAVAEKCGHDRRGNPIFRTDGTPDDDFPNIISAWREGRPSNGGGAL